MKTTLILTLALFTLGGCPSSPHLADAPPLPSNESPLPENQVVFNVLKARDSMLFSLVFEQFDTVQLKYLISEDFEFYHDQNGITASRSAFFKGVAGLGSNPYKTRRVVAANSLKVFPLYDKGQLYGAIQTGRHHFIALEPGKPERLTSTAVFSHLWLLEKGNWKLKRVLSYDHQAP